MANHNDDLMGFEYAPLNAMSSDYDMSIQAPMGEAFPTENPDIYMDPSFWSMDMSNLGNVEEQDQTFANYGLQALDTTQDQGFQASMPQSGTHGGPYFPRDLTSPTSTGSPVTNSSKSTKNNVESKRESSSKKAISVAAEEPDEDKGDLSVTAEEDKRRRNTAASARFRVKKKQREQAMEKTAKEMTDKVNMLESRVKDLEKENMLLKGLLTEKATGKKAHSEASSSDEETIARSSKRVKTEQAAR